MYQSVIRDPGGNGLIRIQPDVCDPNYAVVNGSLLIVPPGTTAIVAANGLLSRPYSPGRYEIFTGIDPFFVRLRNTMTRGDAGTTFSVFFISTEKAAFLQFGTGEIPFVEQRFQITMRALAACSLTFTITNPLRLLKMLIGSYSSAFSEDDLEPCLQQLVLMPVREALSKSLGKHTVAQFNSNLNAVGNSVISSLSQSFSKFGMGLTRFEVTSINIPDSEFKRLNGLEQSFAEGKAKTELELDHLQRVWSGDVRQRTLAEMMTGMPARGGASGTSTYPSPAGAAGGMAPMMAQIMMLSQILPALREPLASMTQHTDLFGGGNTSSPHEEAPSADSPPPMPGQIKMCPSCNGRVPSAASHCPICGHQF